MVLAVEMLSHRTTIWHSHMGDCLNTRKMVMTVTYIWVRTIARATFWTLAAIAGIVAISAVGGIVQRLTGGVS